MTPLLWFLMKITNFIQKKLTSFVLRTCLVAKFKIPNLSHRTGIVHAWSIKFRRNKQVIVQFAYKLRDESNEPN